MWSRIKNALPELGRFNAAPAAMIERIYLNEPASFLGRRWNDIKKSVVFAGLFVPATVIDMAVSGVLGVRYGAGVFFRDGKVQDERVTEFKKYGSIFGKGFLALLASPAGVIVPKLVELNFNTKKPVKGVISGGKASHSPDTKIEYPKTVEEVARIIQNAAQKKQKVMPIGAGLSQGKQFIPEGAKGEETVAIDMSHMNTIQINAEEKTATIGAGVRWADLQIEADKHGLALMVQQASNVFSGGGSVGTNIHGWDHRTGMLSNTILSIDIINAQGEKQTLTPKDELFHCVMGGLGMFGVITSIKMKLTDNLLLKEIGTKVKISDYVRHFRENVMPNEDIRMHLFRLPLDTKDWGAGIAVDYVKAPNQPALHTTPGLAQEAPQGSRMDRVMVNLARLSETARRKYFDSEEKRLLRNDSEPMTINAIMQPPIKAMFNDGISQAEWLQEYFLPQENLPAFLQELARILTANGVALINASVRFVKQNDKSPMSYARGGDRFAVVLCFNQPLQPSQIVKASKWLRAAQHAAVEMGGAYYLPYQHVSNPEDFRRAYPGADEAMRMKEKVDPQGLFQSGLYQKYLAPKEPKPNYFKEIMKTKEMQDRFSGFLKVVLQRVESKDLYKLLADILTYKDTHAEIYQELCLRMSEISPSALADFRHILNSLSTIKEDLGAQANELLKSLGVKEINGIVEVGYPGRFIGGFKKNFKVTGNIVAAYEGPSPADYVQTGFPRPYHQFTKLDYSCPDLANVATASADVVTCYVGLHHFPEAKLKAFLLEVKRVLRPGGHFLLVDHDVTNAQDMAMAHGAHMIFNAVTGASLQDEMNETRLFRSMEHWKNVLQEVGLGYDVVGADVPMIRAGDPSRNRMVCCTKPKLELENKVSAVAQPAAPAPKQVQAPAPQPLPDWRQQGEVLPLSAARGTTFAQAPTLPVVVAADPDRKPGPKVKTA